MGALCGYTGLPIGTILQDWELRPQLITQLLQMLKKHAKAMVYVQNNTVLLWNKIYFLDLDLSPHIQTLRSSQ